MRKGTFKAWRPGKGRYHRPARPVGGQRLGRLADEVRDLAAEEEAAARATDEIVTACAEIRGTLDERLARNGEHE